MGYLDFNFKKIVTIQHIAKCFAASYLPQHFLNFLPLPHIQGSFLPILG